MVPVQVSEIEFELDHIGIAVESLEKGFEFYKGLGFSQMATEVVESQKVKVGFIDLGPVVEGRGVVTRIELLEPTSDESPIKKFLEKRGPGIHHICLRVKDISEKLERLKEAGYKLIHEQPFVGAHNCLVAFVHPKSTGGVLLELSELQGE